jgi:hypothetical protein
MKQILFILFIVIVGVGCETQSNYDVLHEQFMNASHRCNAAVSKTSEMLAKLNMDSANFYNGEANAYLQIENDIYTKMYQK